MKALLALLLCAAPALAQPSSAVVKVESHGASATVIHTEPGRTLLLGCAHAYEGKDRYKAHVLQAPSAMPGPPKPVTIRVLDVDYRADLSLIEVSDGPWPYVAAVPQMGYRPGRLISAGYDKMQGLVAVPVHLTTTYTQERPVPGRSGGGLIDEKGWLVGVCQGYEVRPGGRGMYVDLQTIQGFLEKQGWRTHGAQQAVPVQPAPPCPT